MIKLACVTPWKELGAAGQVRFRCAEIEVKVIRHQYDGVDQPPIFHHRAFCQIKERLPVSIVQIDVAALHTPTRQVIQRVGKLNSQPTIVVLSVHATDRTNRFHLQQSSDQLLSAPIMMAEEGTGARPGLDTNQRLANKPRLSRFFPLANKPRLVC